MALVSAIIPCYNVSPFVDKLSWIFEQTYPELEVVLVDDCSTDDTWQKLQKFKQQHADKRIIIAQNEQNLGVGETRNHGFALSSGQYVCFWNADDYAYPLFVEKMLAKIQQEQADFVCCGYNTIDSKGVLEYHKVTTELCCAQSIDELKCLVFSFEDAPWMKLVSRTFLREKVISFPKIFSGQDHCWTLQLVLNANKIAFIDEPYYQYFSDISSSLSHVYDERKIRSFWDLVLFDLEYIKNTELYSSLRYPWLLLFFNKILSFCNKMDVELQKKFLLEVRDFCQSHEISLRGEGLPFTYTLPLYRLLPNVGSLIKARRKLKRGHKLYIKMRQTLALINIVELVIQENAKKAARKQL